MKQKISITIEAGTVKKLEEFVKDGTFRNKSHLIESAVTKMVKELQK